MIGIEPANLAPSAEALFTQDRHPGGIFISGDLDPASGEALQTIASEHQLLIAIDEEGGRVQGIQNLHGRMISAREMADLSPQEIEAVATERAGFLRSYGINVDFAPVVDVESDKGHAVIGDRSFSQDPQVVIESAGAFAQGLRNVGVLPTLKHFPGHGSAIGDSHESVVSTDPLDTLESRDILPFAELVRLSSAVMVGHLRVPQLTGNLPATLSPEAYSYLRRDLAFDGLVVTDDLSRMQGARNFGTSAEIAVMALDAGADLVLFVAESDFDPVVDAIATRAEEDSDFKTKLDSAWRRVAAAANC